jgi:hypothetical protein
MKREPPKLATALLAYLRPKNEAIIGDLAEEYQAGRSALWYWRQVVGAIVFGAALDIREHKVATVRALALGVACVWLMSRFVLLRFLSLDEYLFTTGLVKSIYLNHWWMPGWVGPIPATALMFAISGWIVGRTHRRYGPSMVLAYTACTETMIFIGWTVVPDPFRSGIQIVLELFVTYPFAALLGGLWALRTRGSSDMSLRGTETSQGRRS